MSQRPLNVGLVGGGKGAFIVQPHQKAIHFDGTRSVVATTTVSGKPQQRTNDPPMNMWRATKMHAIIRLSDKGRTRLHVDQIVVDTDQIVWKGDLCHVTIFQDEKRLEVFLNADDIEVIEKIDPVLAA